MRIFVTMNLVKISSFSVQISHQLNQEWDMGSIINEL